MKKKLFTLLTLLLCLTTGAWADTELVNVDFTSDEWSGKAFSQGNTTTPDVINGITFYSKNNSKQFSLATGGLVFPDNNMSNNNYLFGLPITGINGSITITFKHAYNSAKASFNYFFVPDATEFSTSNGGSPIEVKDANNSDTEISITVETDKTKGYLYIGRKSSNFKTLKGFTVTTPAPSTPTITKQPESASYITGQTIEALTVEATASAGTLTYQWYSCADAEKTNAAEISGAKSASYTPTAAGFYYVTVTDGNGSVDSDVVEITVSAAEAPTINVSGAPVGDIVTGTEVTLTATMTGVPTPTIQWYSNTSASTTGGTAIDGATNDTYAPSTATPGTYYYYAVATNSVDNATSELQTLVVKDKVATPTFTPNGAYFDAASQSVAITCTTAGANIQYSTDGGSNWTGYTEPFNVTATTTVKAKATKDGCIDSDVATATFTKVTLTPQADVTGATTWDWSDVTNSSAVDFSDTSLNGVDVTFANIPAYDFTAVSGLAAQDALLMNGQRAYNNANGSKHCQVNYLKFNTTVPGKVTVEYANTGNNDPRTVKVNGTKGSKSSSANNSYQSETFVVAAGAVTIAGVQVSDDAAKMLRIRKVVFTPAVSGKITPAGWASFSSNYTLDLSTISGGTAYYASNAEGNTVTLKETTATVPAGTGLMIKGTADDMFTIDIAESGNAITGNLLKASNGSEVAASATGTYHYVFGYDKNNASIYGFYNLTQATTVPAGKAYLETSTALSGGGARALIIIDDENTTGISATLTNNETLNNEYFDLQGRRVAQPTKGLYIVNGKKVIVR